MSLSLETYTAQSQLAKYCRDGIEVALPGVTPDRVHQYRRLVFNIIQDNIESAYPIAFKYLQSEIWEQMVYDFFFIHECQSFQVWKLPKEFLDFVLKNEYASKHNIPYLKDLLNFEWAEMELYNMSDKSYEKGNLKGDIINGVIKFNPEFLLLPLEYPVHMYSPIEVHKNKGNYFVLLFRDKESGNIEFVDLSVWYAFIIEQINENNTSINELLTYAPQLFGSVSLDELRENTKIFISSMIEKNFVIEIQ